MTQSSPAVLGPVESSVGPHLVAHSWHWVQFETMEGDWKPARIAMLRWCRSVAACW